MVPRLDRLSRRRRSRGQTLVEFALVLPIMIVMLLSIIEFAFVFNAVLSANYATRDASLIAAEAGSATGADCVIIAKVLEDMKAPVDANQVQQIIIYRANPNGAPIGGSYTAAGNVYDRGGTIDCSAVGGSSSVPFTLTASNYPEGLPASVGGSGNRCNFLNGCPNNTTRTRDAVGVRITYQYTWHTPLVNFINFGGSGFTIIKANEMRMEPVL